MTVNSSFHTLISTLIVVIAAQNFVLSPVHGFSADLIHRDSPKSPYHNRTASYYETLHKSFLRSFLRAKYLKTQILNSNKKPIPSDDGFQSTIGYNGGEYLMAAAIGTPPVDFLAIADTGSDRTWIQCEPCNPCFTQHSPLFDPSESSSYYAIPCNTEGCSHAGSSICKGKQICQYESRYGDGSYSLGDVATETFTFQSTTPGEEDSITNVVFGCGRQNDGTFNENGSGIIGLGGGPLSIIIQLDDFVMGKFSYCLVASQSTATSKIRFGPTAVVSGPQTVTTPLYTKGDDTFYFLNIEGISVGSVTSKPKKIVPSVKPDPNDPGNIVIDSGTTLSFLPPEIYNQLEAMLRDTIRGRVIPGPEGTSNLCYRNERGIQFPDIVVHFTGADVTLPSSTNFLLIDEGTFCLTLVPAAPDSTPILGNLAQINYHVGYDLVAETVSFEPTDCTTIT